MNSDRNKTPLKRLKELRKEIYNILDKGIEQFLLPYAEDSKKLYIYIQGYTPDFNDGDPCRHSVDVYKKEEILNYIFEEEEEIFSGISKEDIKNSRDWPDKNDFRDCLEEVGEVLTNKYTTDFQVLITLKDGKIHYIKDEYNCGY